MFLDRKLIFLFFSLLFAFSAGATQPDLATIIRDLDSANQSRFDNVLSFTDVQHDTVFRGDEQAQPTAEMPVSSLSTIAIAGSSLDAESTLNRR